MHNNPANPIPVEDHFCTAALISKQHVLSTAHCIARKLPNETVVLAGTNNLIFGRLYRISWWITYNEWAELRRRTIIFEDNDISIIKVNQIYECINKFIHFI
jgi:V8-like Glu-specific endopeptidase